MQSLHALKDKAINFSRKFNGITIKAKYLSSIIRNGKAYITVPEESQKNDLNNIENSATVVNIYEYITLGKVACPCKLSARQFIPHWRNVL